MTVPDFQTIMLPLVSLAGDGQERPLAGALNELADRYDHHLGAARTFSEPLAGFKDPLLRLGQHPGRTVSIG